MFDPQLYDVFCKKKLILEALMYVVFFLQTIATVCMFLAGKVEETPRPLKDVILVSYEIIHKKDAAAVQRIKQKVLYNITSMN